MFVLEKSGAFLPKSVRKILKITIPENLNYEGAFNDILERYTDDCTLSQIKTTDLGSLFLLSYNVSVKPGANEQEFINELRTRNGNLTIQLSEAAKIIK